MFPTFTVRAIMAYREDFIMDQTNALAQIMNEQAGASICSIQPGSGDAEQDKKLFNAMNNPTHRLKDFINKPIRVENVLVEVNNVVDADTGEFERVPRVVLIEPDGTSYAASSKGVFNSIKNAYKVFGPAPWDGGREFTVKQVQVGKGNMLTLDLV